MRSTPRRSTACVVAALAVLSAPLGRARRPDRPTFRSSARLVELSVVVTDRDGKPVTFMEQIRPSDRVGLYGLGGGGWLRVLHDFTSDATALVRAISRLRGNVSTALAGEEDAERLEAEMAEMAERFHRIRIKVNRPGLDVRHRHGYFATATQKQANAQRSAAIQAAVASPIDATR